jgi:hypothetical protein
MTPDKQDAPLEIRADVVVGDLSAVRVSSTEHDGR